MIRTTPVDRYLEDAHFRQLVDALYGAIEQAQFTPTEIREAAMLAQIKFEELHIRRLVLDAGWPRRGV